MENEAMVHTVRLVKMKVMRKDIALLTADNFEIYALYGSQKKGYYQNTPGKSS